MRKSLLVLLLAATCVSVTGCGGCGSGMSEADMRRRSRKRAPEDEEAPLPAVIAKAPQTPAAPSPPKTSPAQPAVAPAAAQAAKTKPKTGSPAATAAKSPATVATPKPPAAPATTPAPSGPIQVVVQNAVPASPLTPEEKRLRSVANLRKLGQALLAHAERTGSLPAAIRDEQGRPLLSWRVALLPDLGYSDLYSQFRLGEAWDSQHNSQLAAQIPPELQSPERFDKKTNYLGLAGSGQSFGGVRGSMPSAMEDGPENTVLVIEVDDQRAIVWTAPDDFQVAAGAPRGGIGKLRADGAFALLGDGRVVRLGPELAEHELLALFSPDGGEPLAAAELLKEPTATPLQVAAAPAPEALLPAVPLPVEGTAASAASAPPGPRPITPPGALVGEPPAPAGESKLVEVPPEEALAQARDLLRDLYGKQYAEARSWQDKARLAQHLLTEASKIEANPAHYHELLRIARDVAVAGGDAAAGQKAVQLLTQRFQVDGLALRLKLLDDLAKSPRKTESAEAMRNDALQLLLDAFDADNFDVALPAYERLVEFTRIKGDRAELARLAQRKQPLEAAKQAYVAAASAAAALKANPSDAAASETLGKYLCFVKNRWDVGLPHLVRAAEVKLRVVATIDLEATRSPQDTLSLADQYWEMADDYKQPFSRGLHLRAAQCYQTAHATLPDGLEKLKAHKRIDEVGEIYGKEIVARALAPPAVPTSVTMD